MNIKKRILAGILGGALFLTSSQAFASPPEMPADDNPWQEEMAANIGGWAKFISTRYGLSSEEVETALNNRVHIEDVRRAAVLAKLSGKSFSEVLAMKVDWPQVAQKLGITREQVDEFFWKERNETFAERLGISTKTFEDLLKDGYDVRDISIAGLIAKNSGKNIKTVLEKRRINNTWDDVAKSFGVDLKKVMSRVHENMRERMKERMQAG